MLPPFAILGVLKANPNFATTLTLPTAQGGTVNIGLPEVYLFEAYVQSLRTQLALSLAYVRDTGTNTTLPGPPVPVNGAGGVVGIAESGNGVTTSFIPPAGATPYNPFVGLDKNGDGKLTPDEYLPASPYLTLRDAGLLQKAQQALQAMADRETKGIQGVFARPSDGSGSFLIPNSRAVHSVLDNALTNVVPLLQQAAVGPVTISIPDYQPLTVGVAVSSGGPIPGKASHAKSRRVFLLGGAGTVGNGPVGSPIAPTPLTFVSVTFNLAAWFTSPPADLKAFAPTYTFGSNGLPDFSKTTYPDNTFSGLFPNGLPTDLML